MDQTIENFYNVASNKDFARLFQFRVTSFGRIQFADGQRMFIETASLPGRQINNIPVPYMGLQFNVPGTASYPGSANYQVTFRCDESYDIRAALETEMFATFDDSTTRGNYNISGRNNVLTMELVDKNFNTIRAYDLVGVYVQSLADTQYDVKDNGSVASVQATLAYQFWRVYNKEDRSSPNTGLLQGVFSQDADAVTEITPNQEGWGGGNNALG